MISPVPIFMISPVFIFMISLQFLLGFNGTDCSFDVDLCSMGVCSNYSLSCTETDSGHNYSCACGPGKYVCM